ncbi:MAG: sigma-70 family RNA polymerase sigma factor [Chloroflexi bacterium]|nr:sigma-70 family RNA polymerase sigma factor [Chloroflexota bacterium]MCI0577696.1 sigma-70 family RNA polymerase sigma factor [Chloroflexota bacterium]MCI0645730.1 sigma-70 family RNA polymerase sigma factor [Chloroflexota bacterium]MCI0728234.1 sigma-70 family RNA polymerase sigma factor [Chloroflexota bacterium]
MCGENQELVAAVEAALQRVAAEEPGLAAAIRPLVFAHLSECRVRSFLNSGTVLTPGEYILRVVTYYQEWHEYVYQLQVEKNPHLWEALLVKLQKWAYAFLRRKGVPQGTEIIQVAADCAADAGTLLARLRFPFDTHFDAWACTVAKKVCQQQLSKLWSKNDSPYKAGMALEEQLKTLGDPASLDDTRLVEIRLDLLQAIEQLASETRQQFILLYYFEQRSFDEVAEVMGRSKNALYKLHFDTLKELGKILAQRGNKYE